MDFEDFLILFFLYSLLHVHIVQFFRTWEQRSIFGKIVTLYGLGLLSCVFFISLLPLIPNPDVNKSPVNLLSGIGYFLAACNFAYFLVVQKSVVWKKRSALQKGSTVIHFIFLPFVFLMFVYGLNPLVP